MKLTRKASIGLKLMNYENYSKKAKSEREGGTISEVVLRTHEALAKFTSSAGR